MRFCTIFPSFESIHRDKDVGLIPKLLSDKYKVDSFLLYHTFNKGKKLKDCDTNLTLLAIYANNLFLFYFKTLFFIFKNKIDVINLYHFKKETYFFSTVLRFFCKKVYVKLDIDNIQFELLVQKLESNTAKGMFIRWFIGGVHMISVESQPFFLRLRKYPFLEGKIFLLRNGPSKDSISFSKPLDMTYRKNNILIAARLGVEQKNHEMIFEWLGKVGEKFGWSVSFAGKKTKKFDIMFSEFKRKHPEIKVIYLGELSRSELFKQYAESKVFLMTSKWEGQSLAMVEAAVMGLYIITTPVSGAYDITDSEKYGLIVNEENILSKVDSLLNSTKIEDEYYERLTYAREKFLLDNSIVELANKLYVEMR